MKAHTRWFRIRNSIALLLLVLLTMCTASVARADTGPSPAQPITLADALAHAREDSPAVLQAIAAQRASNAQFGLARAPLLPVVTGTANVSTGAEVGPNTVGSQSSAQSGSPVGADAAITARWTLWDFGRTALGLDAARDTESATAQDTLTAQRNAESQTAAAFFVALSDQAVIQNDEAIVAQRAHELEITRGLVNAGTGQPIDLTRAQVTLSAAQLDLVNARAALRSDTAALAAAFALDPSTSIDPVAPPALAPNADPTNAANRAVERRPEVAAARDRLASAESGLSAARAAYRPALVTTASADVGTAVGSDSLSPRGSVSGMIGISVPIFDPTIASNVRLADASVANARAALDAAELSVRTDAVEAANAVQSATESETQADQLASVAAANLGQAEGRYQAGVAPMLELVDAQSADATARSAVIRAQFQRDLAAVHLLAATGDLDAVATPAVG